MCEGTGGLGRELLLDSTERKTSRDEVGTKAVELGSRGGIGGRGRGLDPSWIGRRLVVLVGWTRDPEEALVGWRGN